MNQCPDCGSVDVQEIFYEWVEEDGLFEEYDFTLCCTCDYKWGD